MAISWGIFEVVNCLGSSDLLIGKSGHREGVSVPLNSSGLWSSRSECRPTSLSCRRQA